MKMHECPSCKGRGKQSIKVVKSAKEGVVESVVQISCATCRGACELTQEQLNTHKRLQEAWCRCGNPSGDVEYYEFDNGAHGYDCVDCGKILQTG